MAKTINHGEERVRKDENHEETSRQRKELSRKKEEARVKEDDLEQELKKGQKDALEKADEGGGDGGVKLTVIATGAVGMIGGAAAAPAAAVAAVNAVGFTATGVAAGSIAASCQGAAVAAGSSFAAAQSIGATGTLAYLGAGSLAVVGAGAVVGCAVVGCAGYALHKALENSKAKEKDDDKQNDKSNDNNEVSNSNDIVDRDNEGKTATSNEVELNATDFMRSTSTSNGVDTARSQRSYDSVDRDNEGKTATSNEVELNATDVMRSTSTSNGEDTARSQRSYEKQEDDEPDKERSSELQTSNPSSNSSNSRHRPVTTDVSLTSTKEFDPGAAIQLLSIHDDQLIAQLSSSSSNNHEINVSGWSSLVFDTATLGSQVLERDQLYQIVLPLEIQKQLVSGNLALAKLKNNQELINGLVMKNNGGIETAAGFRKVASENAGALRQVLLQTTSFAVGQYHLSGINESLTRISEDVAEIKEHLDYQQLATIRTSYEELKLMSQGLYPNDQKMNLWRSIHQLLEFHILEFSTALRIKNMNSPEGRRDIRTKHSRFDFVWRLYQCFMLIWNEPSNEQELVSNEKRVRGILEKLVVDGKEAKPEKPWHSFLHWVTKEEKEKDEKELQEWRELISQVENSQLPPIKFYVRPVEEEADGGRAVLYFRAMD